MNYIDRIVDAPFNTQESQDEAGAAHQMALDVLYRVGCQYNVAMQDMVTLCQLASIDFKELQKYSGIPATSWNGNGCRPLTAPNTNRNHHGQNL